MPNTAAQSIENWLRERSWNSILGFIGVVFCLISFGVAVAYDMIDKHPYWGSLLFFAAFALLIAGGWHASRASHSVKWMGTAVAVILFGVGDYYWIKSLNQPVPWLVGYVASHVAWALVFVLGFSLVVALVRRPKESGFQVLSTSPAQTPDTTNSPIQPLTLPELRPKIEAVDYRRIANVPALGFVTAHEGEPAYDVTIPDVKLGTSLITFEGSITRLEGRSTSEWRVLIKHDTGGFSTGNSLREEMRRQGIGEIVVPIRYRDGDRLWYVSHSRIALDPSKPSGLAVHNDGQELISGRPIQDYPSFPSTAPRPYLEVEDRIDEWFGKTNFTFTNRGGDVAHNIQVQPLVVDHLTVVFDPIAIIAVNETKGTLPKIPGGIVPRHDILAPMEREWNKAFLNAGIPEGQKIEEWVKQVTVTYEDFAGKQFEVTADLVVFPVQRTLRDKHALENSRRQYKTVEVRNIVTVR